MEALVAWLDRMGTVAFVTSAGLLAIIDMTAVFAVVVTRDRRMVNRWTSRVLAVNLLLLGAGLGVPLAAFTTRTVVSLVRPLVPTAMYATHADDAGARRAKP